MPSLFQALAEVCRRASIPLIAIFGGSDADKAAVFEAGFRDYISYPFIQAEIEIRLEWLRDDRSVHSKRLPVGDTDNPSDQRSPVVGGPMEREISLVETTCAFLIEDFTLHVGLDKLARRMGTNRNSLARAFRQVLGKGVHSWLREQRLKVAAELLSSTDLSILSISYDVGYDDPNNFSTSFKRSYGLSPRSYRQSVRESKN